MEEKKVDRRILKTKKAIRNAYAELLKKKNSKNITIKDVADVADISRKTFYYYYDGIWEIEDEIENEIIELLSKELETLNIDEIIKNPYLLFQKIKEVINKDLDFFGNLIVSDKHSKLILKISNILEEAFINSLIDSTNLDKETVKIISNFCMKGMLAVYQEWFNSGCRVPLQEISKDLSKIMFDGLNGYLK